MTPNASAAPEAVRPHLPGRDNQGRFSPGNAGGPGNPYARQTALMIKAARQAVSLERVTAILEKLGQMAEEGDVAAAKVVLAYVIGKPMPINHPDLLDYEEFQLHKKCMTQPQETHTVLGSVPVEMGNLIVRAALPPLHDQALQVLGDKTQESLPASKKETPGSPPANRPVSAVDESALHTHRSSLLGAWHNGMSPAQLALERDIEEAWAAERKQRAAKRRRKASRKRGKVVASR